MARRRAPCVPASGGENHLPTPGRIPPAPFRAEAVAVDFPEVTDTPIRPSDWGRVRFDRRTERYREAIGLARMILLDERPDLRWGDREVVALLFDMNALFEAYLEAALRGVPGVRVKPQAKRPFWQPVGQGARILKPDLLVYVAGERRPVVVDAKWKMPHLGRPDDDDLRQIFAYLHGFDAERGVLVHPRVGADHAQEGAFLAGTKRGRVAFLDLFPAGGKPNLQALRATLPGLLGLDLPVGDQSREPPIGESELRAEVIL